MPVRLQVFAAREDLLTVESGAVGAERLVAQFPASTPASELPLPVWNASRVVVYKPAD